LRKRGEAISTRRGLRPVKVAAPPPLRDEPPKRGEAAMATAHVTLSNGFSRRYTGGLREFATS
jgi:hypothetical protein